MVNKTVVSKCHVLKQKPVHREPGRDVTPLITNLGALSSIFRGNTEVIDPAP